MYLQMFLWYGKQIFDVTAIFHRTELFSKIKTSRKTDLIETKFPASLYKIYYGRARVSCRITTRGDCYYRPQGKVMFVSNHSVHRGGGVSQHAIGPGDMYKGRTYIPPDHRHLVTVNAAVGMHPTGMHSCFRSNIH